MSAAKLPPFSEVIKSRDVEDPVNLWVHRPLAYGLVALTFRTPVTPNQITLLALLMGITAGVLWFIGTPTLMIVGGALLWTSSILDGADGILARAKQLFSDFGRALDGSADMIVAMVTVAGAFYHIWSQLGVVAHLPLMAVALITAVMQINLYDFYKECYLNSTNPRWDGRTPGRADAEARLRRAQADGAPFLVRFAWSSMAGMLAWQDRLRRLTNPRADRTGLRFVVNAETVAISRAHGYGPMQLWTLVSLCPHTYLMSICGMADRLDLYMWWRVVGGNALFLAAILWQRAATARTLQALGAAGLSPVPEDPAGS